MKPNFASVVSNFAFEGDFLDAAPYGFGHINDTYAARFRQPDGAIRRYILQRINHEVFRYPEGLMQNIERVTIHLRGKIAAAGGDPDRETLNLIRTLDGNAFYKTPAGNYWRAYIFIEDAQTYQVVESLDHFYHGGKAFGKFMQLLSDFPANQLYDTIPNFHHTRKRFEAFCASVEKDVVNRAQPVHGQHRAGRGAAVSPVPGRPGPPHLPAYAARGTAQARRAAPPRRLPGAPPEPDGGDQARGRILGHRHAPDGHDGPRLVPDDASQRPQNG